MSKELRDAVNQLLIVKGVEAYSVIGRAIKRSPKTVRRWMKEGVPSPHYAYKLALACGCSEEDARAIAAECASERARESA